jgi:nitrate reductase beta subunit
MVWYIPPLSPVADALESGKTGLNGILPDVDDLRIPNKYLANMFTAGDEVPIINALRKMLAIRSFMRSKTVDNEQNINVLTDTGLTPEETGKMYDLMAIANYNDRFVIPSSHTEYAKNAFGYKAACGFTHGEGRDPDKLKNLFGGI